MMQAVAETTWNWLLNNIAKLLAFGAFVFGILLIVLWLLGNKKKAQKLKKKLLS